MFAYLSVQSPEIHPDKYGYILSRVYKESDNQETWIYASSFGKSNHFESFN